MNAKILLDIYIYAEARKKRMSMNEYLKMMNGRSKR